MGEGPKQKASISLTLRASGVDGKSLAARAEGTGFEPTTGNPCLISIIGRFYKALERKTLRRPERPAYTGACTGIAASGDNLLPDAGGSPHSIGPWYSVE